ncbi:MAG: NAD(P)-binding domain-containing protein, partial [Proteobacteria bacterium]|nr:NAD(P)-binding domain-containing protein [Pseudomonadota bacterium]
MSEKQINLATVVIGAGAWGTALAIAIARNGNDVLLWGRDKQHLSEMQATRTNERYLPGLAFPDSLHIATDFEAALASAEHVLISVPSIAFSEILHKIAPLIKA